MKNLLISIVMISIISCKSQKSTNIPRKVFISEYTTSINGKVKNIDSLNNYYLIYVSVNEKLYKLISKKNLYSTCNAIRIDSIYTFNIKELLPRNPPQNTNSEFPTPINYLDMERCLELENNTRICTEAGVSNIHSTNSLDGLCIITKR